MKTVKIFNAAEAETESFEATATFTNAEQMVEEFYRYDTELTGEGGPSADFTILASGQNGHEFWAVLSYRNPHLSGTLYVTAEA